MKGNQFPKEMQVFHKQFIFRLEIFWFTWIFQFGLISRFYQMEKCISPSHLGKSQVQKDLDSSEMLIKLGFPCFQNNTMPPTLFIPSLHIPTWSRFWAALKIAFLFKTFKGTLFLMEGIKIAKICSLMWEGGKRGCGGGMVTHSCRWYKWSGSGPPQRGGLYTNRDKHFKVRQLSFNYFVVSRSLKATVLQRRAVKSLKWRLVYWQQPR